MEQNTHIWNFSSVGGVKRVNIESGADLVALENLDQKLWTALSCPVHGLEIDQKTLELIDNDYDGRIRVPEILAAVKWITSVVNNPDDLLKQETNFPLSSINTFTDEGKTLLASAKQILKNIDKSDFQFITVEDASDINKIFASTKFNGDGIITEDSTDEPELKKLISEIVLCEGSEGDRSGKQGVTQSLIESFYENCTKYSQWQAEAENNYSSILPFGEYTEEALLIFNSIKSKVEDYFIRCRLAEFDPESKTVLNALVAQFESISMKDLSGCMDEIATYPIAKIEAGKALPLDKGINPAWESQISKFKNLITDVLFKGKKTLSEKDWETVTEIFSDYLTWKNSKTGESVETLGLERIREILDQNQNTELLNLIEQDKALENEANNIILVEKLVRFYRDIYTLLKNFVTFYDFYSPHSHAIFQAGTLYIDRRSCDLCIRVNDISKHNVMVGLSGMYLIYCDCKNKANEKMTIVAAMTNGDIDNLMVGRNAVFYDRNGGDWDATVTKIIENPISIRQAFWSPYRKVSRAIENQIHKFASAKEKEVHDQASTHIEKAPDKIEAVHKTPPPPFDIGKFVGIFAAIGLAIGAIGTALAAFLTGFLNLVWWKMPLAVAGLMLVISGPSMIIALLKLRKRNLAPLLDANGWAINAKAIVNIPFGNTLTHLATLPKNAKINLNDPFTKKKRPFLTTAIILVILIGGIGYLFWRYGYLQKWLFGH